MFITELDKRLGIQLALARQSVCAKGLGQGVNGDGAVFSAVVARITKLGPLHRIAAWTIAVHLNARVTDSYAFLFVYVPACKKFFLSTYPKVAKTMAVAAEAKAIAEEIMS